MTDAAADRLLIALDAFVGVGAVGGGLYIAGGAKDWDESWLEGSPFSTFTIPGVVLGLVHAPLDLAAAWALARDRPHATQLALASGAVQTGWILSQWRMIGLRSPLQPVFGTLGALSLGLALRRLRRG